MMEEIITEIQKRIIKLEKTMDTELLDIYHLLSRIGTQLKNQQEKNEMR